MVSVVQAATAVCRDGDNVLDPYTESARQVDPRFDGEAHARHKRLLLTLDHVRRLVRGYTDAVSGAMDELLAIARSCDDLPRRPVNLLTTHTGTYGIHSGLLRLPDNLVNLSNLRCRLPDADCTGRVRAVAVPKAAEVEHDRVTRLDHPVPRLMMRIGPIGARSDNGEVDLFMAEFPKQISKIGRDLGLLSTCEAFLNDLAVDRVGRFRGGGEPHQFVIVLDCTHHREALGQRPIT